MSRLIQKAIDFSRGKKRRAPAPEEEDKGPLVPDWEQLTLAARKKAARRTGGRSSTVLSEDRLGP